MSTTYIALLRGINVGGHRKVAMGELRALMGTLGHGDVTTYLQSGNVRFTSSRDDPKTLALELEDALARHLALNVTVMIRTGDQMAAVTAGNPFPEAYAQPTRVHVAFLSAAPHRARLAALLAESFTPDELRAGDGFLYLRYPNGAGRSRLTNDVIERRLGVRATARNWNTVLWLAANVTPSPAAPGR